MRKHVIGLGVFISIVSGSALTGCTVASDAADQYAVAEPLSVQLELPKNKQPDQEGESHTFKATVWQNEKQLSQVDFVHFEIWKVDGTLTYSMEPAETEKNGVYSIQKTLPKSGLYYVKVHAGVNSTMIMPTKQFIIGELSKADLKILQDGAQPENGNSGHHH